MEADKKIAPALARQGSANNSTSNPVTATPTGQGDVSDKPPQQIRGRQSWAESGNSISSTCHL